MCVVLNGTRRQPSWTQKLNSALIEIDKCTRGSHGTELNRPKEENENLAPEESLSAEHLRCRPRIPIITESGPPHQAFFSDPGPVPTK